MASAPVPSGRIFISYRREESAYPAGWLFDRLVQHFGRGQIFKDLDSIQLGDDFVEVITSAVVSCDVLLALIGDHWLTITGQDGRRRLHDPDDFVRLEIEAALSSSGVRVIPVLVEGAHMPRAADLPASLARLERLQALELSPSRFDFDVSRLLRALDQALGGAGGLPSGAPTQGPFQVVSPPSAGYDLHRADTVSAPIIRRGPAGSGPPPAPPGPAAAPGPPAGAGRKGRRRVAWKAALAVSGIAAVVVAGVVFILHGGKANTPPGKPASTASSAAPPAGKVLLTDNFTGQKNGWAASGRHTDGRYTPAGKYRLKATAAGGTGELAQPADAAHGLGGKTPLNLTISVDARKISGAPHGYGYGVACRGDGGGDYYAFVIQGTTVAIEKWVGGGARIQDPHPASTTALHAGGVNHLRASCQTDKGKSAVHLTLWVNGQKTVTRVDRDHPYLTGYLGVYVETTTAAKSTAEAEFDNVTVTKP